MEQEIEIVGKCPECNKRIMDKSQPTSGHVRLKCPHCHKMVVIDFALRASRGYFSFGTPLFGGNSGLLGGLTR